MDAYIGEIRAFPYTYIPEGWLLCDGSTLNIFQYPALAAVIGALYGGNGTSTFALPNLQGSVLQGIAAGASKLTTGGKETVTLNLTQIPAHNHIVNGLAHKLSQNSSTVNTPVNTAFLTNGVSKSISKGIEGYSAISNNTLMNVNTISVFPATPATAHENRMPYLAFIYCICATGGTFPPRP
ncbi:MAG: tail fiber protein [Sphingobacteriia bacterium]|nr:tail fiber protein [Sphingobacteriia bacterium]